MHVTFDAQIFSSQAQGGISRYFLELARQLNALPDTSADVLAPIFITRALRDEHRALAARPAWFDRIGTRLSDAGLRSLSAREAQWRRRVNVALSARRLRREEPDVLHETFFTETPLPLQRARRVLTVQDMIDEKFLLASGRTSPAFIATKRDAILRADHVLCSSRQTQVDLLERVSLPESRTSVVHLGCRSREEWPEPTQPDPDLPPYILFVGVRESYKNFAQLLRAFAASRRLTRDCAIVTFGGGVWTADERALVTTLGLDPARLIQRQGDDAVLAGLYRGARVCAYPSAYEGFGLIPLEAMTFGCPVVTTHGGSLAEVVEDAAEVVDPDSVESISVALERAMFDETRRENLRVAGERQVRRFTWRACAVGTRAAYERVLGART